MEMVSVTEAAAAERCFEEGVSPMREVFGCPDINTGPLADFLSDRRQNGEAGLLMTWKGTLRLLGQLPIGGRLKFSEARATNGPPVIRIRVGGSQQPEFQAWGQSPPSQGDSWDLPPFLLQRGRYQLSVRGGANPYHGVLDWTLNGDRVAQQDWYDRRNVCPVERVSCIDVQSSGCQQLSGVIQTKNDNAKGFWMCLIEVTLAPVENLPAPVVRRKKATKGKVKNRHK